MPNLETWSYMRDYFCLSVVYQRKNVWTNPEKTYTYDDFLNMALSSLNDFPSLCAQSRGGKKSNVNARAIGAHYLSIPVKLTQEQIRLIKYDTQLKTYAILTNPTDISDE